MTTRNVLYRAGLLVALGLALATETAAQPYFPIDRRALRETPGAEELPLRQMLDLAYQARLSVWQFDRAIARAGASGDPSHLPDLWKLARAYRAAGSFTDQLFEAMRRLGETDEAFIAEAERVAPTIPTAPWGPNQTEAEMLQAEAVNGLRGYVIDLVQAAAARPDSAFLPRVQAIGRHVRIVTTIYGQALRFEAEMLALPPSEQLRSVLYNAGRAYRRTPRPGQYRSAHEFRGVLTVGDALRPDVVWSRERLAALYQKDPAAVEAAIDVYLVETDAGPDAPDLRTYLLGAAATPVPLLAAVPLCAGQPATVYVSAAGTIVGGPLDGQPYAGRLDGTDGDDVIAGTDAADLLVGGLGDDTLCGGSGDDALDGGPGTDTADGGPGTDGCDTESVAACEGPVPALTDVRPILECVAEQPGGGLTAYFGYENHSGRPGRVAYGANNRITPAAIDGRQPDLFAMPGVVAGRPGRTPLYPGHAFTVPFQPGQVVVWTLFSRTSTASATSTRCPS